MSKTEDLEKRCEELIKEFVEEFHSPKGGFLLIMNNGEGFGHIAFNGYTKVIVQGLKQAMFENAIFRYAVYKACESVMDELDEEFD